MIRKSVNITGPGPHVIVPAQGGQRIMVQRFLLTFSHSAPQSLAASMWSGPDLIAGPFYATDGGVWEYERGESTHYSIKRGDPFCIELAPGLSCAGMVHYELGSW